jgi:hypothetical protein
MKSCKKYIIIFFLFPLISLGQQSVIKVFSNDSIKYFEEMKTFLGEARKDEAKDFMKEFQKSWYGGKFSDKQRKGVYHISNVMLEKKMRPFPDFVNYLNTVVSFVISPYQNQESFDVWQEIVEKLIGGKSRKSKQMYADYIEVCNSLFSENLMYKSAAVSWTASNSNYIFEFDTVPVMIFPSINLICFAKGDSAVIYNTKGVFYPTENLWIGEGGKVDWRRAGLNSNEVYAEIGKYKIKMKSSEFVVDSVIFHNSNYFSKPLIGRLSEKVLANQSEERVSYPRFDSYSKRIQIKNIAENVDYEGGFSMQGAKFVGKGNNEQDAYLYFYRDKKKFITIASKSLSITSTKFASEITSATIYLESDSIYHPGLDFKYLIEKKELTLFRDNKGISISPYFNSYHKLDMEFEQFSWKMDEPLIQFGHVSTKSDAHFESSNYFKLQKYEQLQALDDIHPLVRVRDLSNKLKTNYLTVEQLSAHLRLSENQTELFLILLANKGYVMYDYKNKSFTVKDKLHNSVMARSAKVDYDVIEFNSDISSENAKLNLLNFDLTIYGIKSILLSDSQQVYIFPLNDKITVKKNRDFTFAGIIRAGKFDFYGKEFAFEYDNFKIDLINVDSLKMWATSGKKDEYGNNILIPVKTVIEKMQGNLLIDNSFNKSGKKDYPEYPVLNSFKESFVFYDKKNIQNGVYKRDNFYFKVYPFKIDSLDNMTNEQLRFQGLFASAGVFPDFEEVLTLQPDYSLGFVRKTPPDGYAMYGGKGKFYNDINLSNKGLRGDGKLEYITSTTYSNDFVFHPDSMYTRAQAFDIAEQQTGVEFPPVKGDDVKVHWYPQSDYMNTFSIDKPLTMYENKSNLAGKLRLAPNGLTGKGLFSFDKAEMTADLYKFKYIEFESDTADFRLKDEVSSDAITFATKNVQAYITFKERYGQFRSNGGGSFIEFPQNQYICFMEEFKWFMDNDDIELSASKASAEDASGVKLEGSQFISTHPKQDSLSFFAPSARYDLKRHIIHAKKVRFMQVGDAMIYPDSGKITIYEKAKMETLNNAKVVASYVTQNHKMYNVTADVFGKRSFSGNGYIDYIDETGGKQTIYLATIGVDTTGQTYASGSIEKEVNFSLSPQYDYNGRVFINSNNEFMSFKGYTRIKHDCDLLSKNWFYFHSEINPNEIFIPIDTILSDEEDNKLTASVMLSKDSLGIYSAFANRIHKYSDAKVLPAFGYIYYDKETKEYKISNKLKISSISYQGNYLSLNTETCKIYGEGKMDLGVKTGQVKIDVAGNVVHSQLDNTAVFDVVMILDFFFNSSALEKMASQINDKTSLDPVEYERPVFERALRELMPKEEADKVISQLSLNGSLKRTPDALNKSIVITDVKFKWIKEKNAYKSISRIGVANILKEQVNKYVEGTIEIVKKRSGDIINIYLEIDPNNWYFFSYTRGIMQAISSNDPFNNYIQELKPDKRKMEVQKGQEPFQFMLSTVRKKTDFLKGIDNE